MIKRVYSLLDVKSGVYANPVVYLRDGQAVRDFQALCSDQGCLVGRYPSDFCLYFVGTFDDETGSFSSEKPCLISCGSDFKVVEKSTSSAISETTPNAAGVAEKGE